MPRGQMPEPVPEPEHPPVEEPPRPTPPPVEDPPPGGDVPETPVPDRLAQPTKRISQWLEKFEQALSHDEFRTAGWLFDDASYWRDLIAFTWNITTAEGREAIADMLQATVPQARPSNFRIEGEASEADGITEGWFTFETAAARGNGLVRLKDERCWTLLTAMTELKGFEEKRGPTRDKGVQHGAVKGRRTWREQKIQDEAELGVAKQPYCVIVGGGQGGIALAARLKRLGVPAIIVEKNERAGDSWRKRYKSLCLHDPVWYDHLPYLPFPDHWPVFSPKDKIGDWLESYVKIMELNYWTSTECKSARYDEGKKEADYALFSAPSW